jgi:hypothetical protein
MRIIFLVYYNTTQRVFQGNKHEKNRKNGFFIKNRHLRRRAYAPKQNPTHPNKNCTMKSEN